jgi:hypothetical protein
VNTKEAIEIICVGREKLLTVNETHKVVECLREGEKYRQMWEELYLSKIGWNDYSITIYMQELEKKYFPKESSQDYKEGEE